MLLALCAVVIVVFISQRVDSEVVELKAAYYNRSWLEFRLAQVKYAEIKMMIQDKNILPLPPMSGR